MKVLGLWLLLLLVEVIAISRISSSLRTLQVEGTPLTNSFTTNEKKAKGPSPSSPSSLPPLGPSTAPPKNPLPKGKKGKKGTKEEDDDDTTNTPSPYLGCFQLDQSTFISAPTAISPFENGAIINCINYCNTTAWYYGIPLAAISESSMCACPQLFPTVSPQSESTCNAICVGDAVGANCVPGSTCCGDSTGKYWSLFLTGADPIAYTLNQLELSSGADASETGVNQAVMENLANEWDPNMIPNLEVCLSSACPNPLIGRVTVIDGVMYCKWPLHSYSTQQTSSNCETINNKYLSWGGLGPISFAYTDLAAVSRNDNTSSGVNVGDDVICDNTKGNSRVTCTKSYSVTTTSTFSFSFTASESVTVTVTGSLEENAIVAKATQSLSVAASVLFSESIATSKSTAVESMYQVAVPVEKGQKVQIGFQQTTAYQYSAFQAMASYSGLFGMGSWPEGPSYNCQGTTKTWCASAGSSGWWIPIQVSGVLNAAESIVPFFGTMSSPDVTLIEITITDITNGSPGNSVSCQNQPFKQPLVNGTVIKAGCQGVPISGNT